METPNDDVKTADICDSETSVADTLSLLATGADRRVLRVSRHPVRPIHELVLCYVKCKWSPPKDVQELVSALSRVNGSKQFDGKSCNDGFYIGNNIWGRGFDYRSVYCPNCGYAMEGNRISHVEVARSGNAAWDMLMLDQCEMGASWHEGKNYGVTYEFI